jgi:hypothetical protein
MSIYTANIQQHKAFVKSHVKNFSILKISKVQNILTIEILIVNFFACFFAGFRLWGRTKCHSLSRKRVLEISEVELCLDSIAKILISRYRYSYKFLSLNQINII